MTEKEKKFRKINDEYTQFTYIFYEHMRPDTGRYSKEDVNNQITKLIKSLCDFRKMK